MSQTAQSSLPDVWHTGPSRAGYMQQLWNRPFACRGSQPVRRAAAAELVSGTNHLSGSNNSRNSSINRSTSSRNKVPSHAAASRDG